jgi:YHS domain-containing protein
MAVDEKKTKHSMTVDGMTYYFCSESCMESFKKDPTKFEHKAGHHG